MISERDSSLAGGVRFPSAASLDLLGKRDFQNLQILAVVVFFSIAISRTIVGRGRLQRTPKFTLFHASFMYGCMRARNTHGIRGKEFSLFAANTPSPFISLPSRLKSCLLDIERW